MDSAPLAERIGPLLHQIPHRPTCAAPHDLSRENPELAAFVCKCSCDRESRLAQAVARAIEAAIAGASSAIGALMRENERANSIEAALRALADPQTPEVPHG